MQSTLDKLDNNRVLLKFEANPEEVAAAFTQAYKKVVKQVSVPGFRKGKTPRFILEQQFGKEIFHQDAVEILVTKGYYEAVREHKLEPVDNPKIDFDGAIEEGKPFAFQAEVEVLPEVELGAYKEIKVEKEEPVVTDEEVRQELKALQERHAELVACDKQNLEKGDFAVIDFEGYLDQKPFPGGAAQGYTIEVGAGRFIPGFEDGLIGMAPGEERELNLTFPEEYHQKDLAGKAVVFKVKLHEIKTKELPALDDDFAKSMGEYETLAALEEAQRKRLQEYKEKEARRRLENEVIKKVVAESKVQLTDTLIRREVDHMVHHLEHDLEARGLKLEEYLAHTGQTLEKMREELRPQAEERVKTDLVLSAITKAEGITVSQDELKERVQYLLQFYPPAAQEEVLKGKNPDFIEGVLSSLEREKTVKFIVDAATGEVETAPAVTADEKEEEVKAE
ncbi:MAG: trigger factor [Firmicutes bacterium]|nr:trigger factor [Bacillota bacterium]